MVGGHGGRARKIEMERASERVLRVTHAAEREACVCVCVCVCLKRQISDLAAQISRAETQTQTPTNPKSYTEGWGAEEASDLTAQLGAKQPHGVHLMLERLAAHQPRWWWGGL